MSELVAEAHRLINAASAAIAASTRQPPSATTAMLARMILSEAKKQRPDDAAIQDIDLDGNPDWNDISVAMSVVVRTLG
jgi:hypothetical protein